jgi:hypothetical protein
MKLTTLFVATALAASGAAAFAHAPKQGPHGGPQADAGSFHVEIVPDGTALAVYLRDHSDKVFPSAGFKGTAILLIDGKPTRIPLAPDGDNKLTGTAPIALPAEPKGAVQLVTPAGQTVQAKFEHGAGRR